MTIREFYLDQYPTDDLGLELKENITFTGLLNTVYEGNDLYAYLGVGDSLVRERLFQELATQANQTYDWIYNLWIRNINKTLAV
jgi:hypothetical protein